MIKYKFAGYLPTYLEVKAKKELQNIENINKLNGWKRVASLKNWFSLRLNLKYRMLYSPNQICFIGDHDYYTNKIQILRSKGV